MHELVRVTRIQRATTDVLRILVEAEYRMNLVSEAFIAELQDVVRVRSHRPIVGTNDAFVVVGKHLPSHLGKEAVLCSQLCPCLIEIEAALVALSPNSTMLGSHLCLDVGTLVTYRQTCSLQKELGTIILSAFSETAESHLATPQHIQVYVELVLTFIRFLLSKSTCRYKQKQQNNSFSHYSTSKMLMKPVSLKTLLMSSFMFFKTTLLPPAFAPFRMLMRIRRPLDAM